MPQRVTPKATEDITKEEFQAYEDIRESGMVNMFDPRVQRLARIDRETHLGIMAYYKELCSKWPDVRDLSGKKTEEER